jgi:hypothetical protein
LLQESASGASGAGDKKPAAPKPPTHIQINNEAQMVALMIDVVSKDPRQAVQLSAISERIQACGINVSHAIVSCVYV